MRNLLAFMALALVAGTAFADAYPDSINVPEPETLGLLALGLAGLFIARRTKKK